METLHAYQCLIKENLDYDSLLVSHPHDKNQIDEIVDLIVETVMCKSDKVLIASNWYSGALVRGKFMKLDYSHVEYVLHCLEGRVLLLPLWFLISIIGAGVKLLVHMVAISKKDIGIGNPGFVYWNSDLLSRLAPGCFSSLYGRCSAFYFICWRIYRYCNRLA